MNWSESEIKQLKILYPNHKNEEISIIMKKSIKSIISKSFNIGLKKSKSHISKMKSLRNKKVGRDLTFDTLKEIASNYNTKSHFQNSDPSAYTTARKMGILDEICCHMKIQSFSIPQRILFDIVSKIFQGDTVLYDHRRLINPYEIDVYVQNKIAFEYDGKRWHSNDLVDKKLLCDIKKIDFIKILERNRRYEFDIKEQLKENLLIINKHLNKQIDSTDIDNIIVNYDVVYKTILDFSEIELELKKYKNISELQKKNSSFYQKIRKLDKYDEIISNLRERKKYKIDEITQTISEYKYLLDFIQEQNALYLYIRRHNMQSLLENLLRKSIKINKQKDF
jgi:hypothetical protein